MKLKNLLQQLLDIRYVQNMRVRQESLESNLYYEMGSYAEEIPRVLTLDETLGEIESRGCSICRFGDGEFDMVSGGNMIFQKFNSDLQRRLKEVLTNPIDDCLVCIPPVWGGLSDFVYDEQVAWRQIVTRWRIPITELVGTKRCFGNSFVSRPYLRYRDRSVGSRVFSRWKRIFTDRNLVIVEGRFSRLGVDNDLFSGARSIRRVWCPQIGAFDCYDEILQVTKDVSDRGDLILLALGGTATLLAYDLAKAGYQALDVGHLDIEYIWMKMGATRKELIRNRYIAECGSRVQDMSVFPGEEIENNVVAKVGV